MKNEIKKVLNLRKTNAETLANENLAKALSLPKFKQLYSKEKELMINLAKEGKSLNSNELNKLKELQSLELNKIGLNLKDLKPNYTCNFCSDTGIYEGKTCDCTKKLMSEILLKKSGFNKKPLTFKDSNFEIFNSPEKAKLLYDKMQQWCNKKSKIQNIILSGNTGTGKTFLLECMLSSLIENNKFVYYTTAFSLSQKLLKYHTSFEKDKLNILDDFLNCDYLIIDDLGTEPVYKNVSEEYLYLILNERQIANKHILISTNLDPEKIQERYGERIFSRLLNKRISLLLHIENEDLRLKH